MTLCIVVPVKLLAKAKSRLSPVLASEERLALSWSLLRHVLAVVCQAQEALPARGVVLSADLEVLRVAEAYGLASLPEAPFVPLAADSPAEAALNAAIDQAARWALSQGDSALLVLPSDLPLVSVDDLAALWNASQQLYAARAVVIAPDSHDSGTNALLVRPPGALPFQFGPDSFHRHCQQAQALGLAYHVHRSPRLSLDVDLPADLIHYHEMEHTDLRAPDPPLAAALEPATVAFLEQPGLLMRLGTLGRDGFPHVTPVWYLHQDGVIYITTASDRAKARNMVHDPRVGLAIDSDNRPYRGLTASGLAQVVAEGEAARPLTRCIAARYVPAERLDAMVDSLMQAPRVVFAIHPRRVARLGSWGAAG